MQSLYIHWPFCKKKCPYCDFNSHVRQQVDYDIWRKSLLAELDYIASLDNYAPLNSIFFGGGTPSLMPASIVGALLERAQQHFGFTNNIEITLEANPTSSEAKGFLEYKQAGVNRLSLGVQSLNDDDLKFLGREHSAKEAIKIIELVANHFSRYSFDLIYARPQQTPAQWEHELRQALSMSNGHLSLYQLTIEPDTPFARTYKKGGFHLPPDHIAAALYDITEALCKSEGLHAYEISNYAKRGDESKHNMSYWQGHAYIGIGPGAHGRLHRSNGHIDATASYKSPERWIERVTNYGHGLETHTTLSTKEHAEERLLSGLRMTEGIALKEIEPVINKDKLSLLVDMHLLQHHNERLCITKQGRIVLERIISELLV